MKRWLWAFVSPRLARLYANAQREHEQAQMRQRRTARRKPSDKRRLPEER